MNVRGASLLIFILVAFSFNSLSATAEEANSSGIVKVAGESYTFQIEVCYTMNSGDSSSFMLGGSATASDGNTAMIQVTASKNPKKEEHAVSLIKMPTHYVAHTKKIDGGGWKDPQGEPASALVTVNGKDVSVSGSFYTATYPPESDGVGTISARCDQLMVTNVQ